MRLTGRGRPLQLLDVDRGEQDSDRLSVVEDRHSHVDGVRMDALVERELTYVDSALLLVEGLNDFFPTV